MSRSLGKNVKLTLIQAPLVSGGTDPDSTVIDMFGFEGCMFTGVVGTAGATDTCTVAISESSSSNGSWNALTAMTASTSAGASDKMLIFDLYKPKDQFLRATLTRSAVIEYGGTIATQYGTRITPVEHDSATLGAPMLFGITPST